MMHSLQLAALEFQKSANQRFKKLKGRCSFSTMPPINKGQHDREFEMCGRVLP